MAEGELLPVVTLAAINLGFVLSGAIAVETIYSWPGLGKATADAIRPYLRGVTAGTGLAVARRDERKNEWVSHGVFTCVTKDEEVAILDGARVLGRLGQPHRIPHAVGPHHLCRLAVPALREQERGDIVFISSVATDHMAANGGPYNMAKAAMEALAMTLAKEERRHGIHVNVVAPGLVETEMGRRLVGAAGVTDMRTLDASMPFGRVCQPDDVAGAVRYLVSDGASYVTGQRIRVDGGGQS